MKKRVFAVFASLFMVAVGRPSAVKAEPSGEPAAAVDGPGQYTLVGDESDRKPGLWRRKLNLGFSMMKQTPTGKACYDYGLKNHLRPVWFNRDLTELYTVKGDVLLMSAEIVPAWPDYISWVLVQGFVRFRHDVILKEYGSPEVGNFVELDQWAMLAAMRHWTEHKASLEYDFDSGLVVRREAKVSPFYKAWGEGLDGFLELAAGRHRRLYADSTTMAEFLKNPALPQAAREAVLELNRQWKAVLAEETGRRTGALDSFPGLKPAAPGGESMDSPVLNQLRSLKDAPLQ